MQIREIYLAHELDAAWIIALWKAIHGGDPGPEEIAAQAIAALAQYVAPPAQASFSFNELKEQFGKLGVQVSERAGEASQHKQELALRVDDNPNKVNIHQYCFKFKGETYCIQLPVLTHLRTAA